MAITSGIELYDNYVRFVLDQQT